MIHVTKRAALRVQSADASVAHLPFAEAVCGDLDADRFFDLNSATELIEGREQEAVFFWPDCPTCRVLLDAALEQRDVVALMREVAK